MILKRPLGVLLIGTSALIMSTLYAAWLLIAHLQADSKDAYLTPWEMGTGPLHLSVVAVAFASSIGLLLGRAQARVGMILILLWFAGMTALSAQKTIVFLRDEAPDQLQGFMAWGRLFWVPLFIVAIAAAIAAYLFSPSAAKYFSERRRAYAA